MTKDTTRHLFLVFAISVGLLLPLSFAPLNANEVKYCFRSGPAKSTLAQYDDEVRLLSQQQLIDAEKTHLPLGGHPKTGQLWTGQNRPVREPPQARVFYRVRS